MYAKVFFVVEKLQILGYNVSILMLYKFNEIKYQLQTGGELLWKKQWKKSLP